MGGLPELRFGRAGFLLFEQLAQQPAWALIGWQEDCLSSDWLAEKTAWESLHFYQQASAILPPASPVPLQLLLPFPQQSAGIHSRSLLFHLQIKRALALWRRWGSYRICAKWFFFLYKQSWKTPVWCSVLLTRAIHRKLRFSFIFRKQPLFLVQGLKGGGCSLSSFSFMDTCWGCIFTLEKLFYTTQLCDSSQQKRMKNAVLVTPGHENSEALLKQTH